MAQSLFDIPIFHKIYEMQKLLYSYQLQVPKSQRYTIWQKIETIALDLLQGIIEASHNKGKRRAEDLLKASCYIDLMKVFVRLAKDSRAIDNKKYLQLQEILQEIGKMVGGWMKLEISNLNH